MHQSISFRIDDNTLTENEKMSARQKIIQKNSLESAHFSEIFNTGIDVSIAAKKNCENMIGSVEVPVGVAGPVLITSTVINQEVLIPLATTEGALIASISRGCKAINESNGCSITSKRIGMSRAPVWKCTSGKEAEKFLEWLSANIVVFKDACEKTSSHLQLSSYKAWVRGRYVYGRFVFNTDEAMGMNMVTIALQKAWEEIKNKVQDVSLISLSSNICCDKKGSVINTLEGRGYLVQAEVIIPHNVINNVLHTSVENILEVHMAKNLIGSNLAGSFSQNMHAGNAIAAVFLATGQDIAHVTEASQVTTIIESHEDGLYVSITMPDCPVGVVGGGTWLPAQKQARALMCFGDEVSAQQLAEIIGCAVLAGEISGIAALATQSLAKAHQVLGRL